MKLNQIVVNIANEIIPSGTYCKFLDWGKSLKIEKFYLSCINSPCVRSEDGTQSLLKNVRIDNNV